jgi:hypothetical protein
VTDVFLIRIHKFTDALKIEDRRPDFDLVATWGGFVASMALFVWVGLPSIKAESYLPVALITVAILYLAYRSATRYFRSVYGFDKSRNKYVFFRQALSKKDVIEGTLDEFSAVQVEHAVVEARHGDHNLYRVGLVLCGGLTLGRGSSLYLREKPPLISNFGPEERMASAIAKFLNIRNDGEVEVASFGVSAIGF